LLLSVDASLEDLWIYPQAEGGLIYVNMKVTIVTPNRTARILFRIIEIN